MRITKFIIITGIVIALIFLFADKISGQQRFILGNSEIIVLNTEAPTPIVPTPLAWTYADKIMEGDNLLSSMELKIGTVKKHYFENRISKNAEGKISVTQKRLTDKERDLGIKLLNTVTGEITVIKVATKINTDGVQIVAPEGYQIELVQRSNGIRWNHWNSEFNVVVPANTIVLKNAYPKEETLLVPKNTKDKHGNIKTTYVKKEGIVNFLYVPYSDNLRIPEISRSGSDYIKKTVEQAFANLRERKVMSKSVPGKLVADITALNPKFFQRLPLLEQGDLTEFIVDPEKTAERVLIIVGANELMAYSNTCNWASACGWIQFTPSTYKTIRNGYKLARLINDFSSGAADHVNSIMAAILLHDNNLAELIKRYGEKILTDPLLEEYLAASYNGSPRWVHKSLNANTLTSSILWGKYLREETKGFLHKLSYLIRNDLP